MHDKRLTCIPAPDCRCPICFDMNGYFALILAEVWEAHDAGREDVTWRDVPAARAGLLLF